MAETGFWPLALLVLGVVATIVGLIANLFGITSSLRAMFRKPVPAELDPMSAHDRSERGAGRRALAGAALGAASVVAVSEALRRSADPDHVDAIATGADDLSDLDAADLGAGASNLDDLGDTLGNL